MKFKQVDVFTNRPFLGNPVAVVVRVATATLRQVLLIKMVRELKINRNQHQIHVD